MDRHTGIFAVACLTTFAIAGCSSNRSEEYHELSDAVPAEVSKDEIPAATVAQNADAAAPAATNSDDSIPAESKTPPDASPVQLTRAEENSAAPSNAAPTTSLPGTSAPPGKIELLIPEKSFVPEGKERALRVSFDDLDLLKVLNMEPVPTDAPNYFPGWLKGLDGQTVRLRGWMYPPPEQEGLGGFLFVRDNQICCFGREPKVYDKVGVLLKENVTTDYIQGRPFDVVGKLSIQPEEEDGKLLFLYFIEDAVVVDG
jgi:hypothetical protein